MDSDVSDTALSGDEIVTFSFAIVPRIGQAGGMADFLPNSSFQSVDFMKGGLAIKFNHRAVKEIKTADSIKVVVRRADGSLMYVRTLYNC